jgi:hypothetical protein
MPELAVDPGDPGDDAVGLDGAKNRPCLGIDLMDLPAPMLPPQSVRSAHASPASSRNATRFSAPRGSPVASARAAAVISESIGIPSHL